MKVGLWNHHFRDIWYAGYVIEDDLDATFFNLVASAIPKWWTFNLMMCVQKQKRLNKFWTDWLKMTSTPYCSVP
jgi:hypothetical protein